MKKILLATLLTTILASTSFASNSSNGFVLQKAKISSSSLLTRKVTAKSFNFCEYTCQNDYDKCMARPDPFNVNIDVCGTRLNLCLDRCNGGGWN